MKNKACPLHLPVPPMVFQKWIALDLDLIRNVSGAPAITEYRRCCQGESASSSRQQSGSWQIGCHLFFSCTTKGKSALYVRVQLKMSFLTGRQSRLTSPPPGGAEVGHWGSYSLGHQWQARWSPCGAKSDYGKALIIVISFCERFHWFFSWRLI